MNSYNFVSIFAFILAFNISTGNALQCYQCSYNVHPNPNSTNRDRDRNCVNVNENTASATISQDLTLGWLGCLYFRTWHIDGSYSLNRYGIIVPYFVGKDVYCTALLAGNLGGTCEICYTDFCNSMSAGP